MLIHKPSKSVVLRVKDPERIQRVIPKSRMLDWDGHNLAVRHGIDETRVLRNLGIMVPSPIRYYYDWPGDKRPFAHQKLTSEFATLPKRLFILNEMGTAKTRAVIWAIDYLIKVGAVRRALVIAPLSTLTHVWEQEVFATTMHRTTVNLHAHSYEARLKRLERPADIYIANHHAVNVIGTELRARKDIDLVVWDESSELRNPATDMYKNFKAMLRPDQRLWLVSGAPCPNAPSDAWAQVRLVNPEGVSPYFTHFRRATMMKVSEHRWVPRAGSAELVHAAMQPAIRFRKADCIDLPPVLQEDRVCDMTKAQKDMYQSMRAQMIADSASKRLVAVNAADQINKLRQILCGAVKVADGNYDPIDHKPRLQLLLDCIAEAAAKVVVVVPFKGIVRLLEQEISPHYTCGMINGDVPVKERNDIITRFKNTDSPHVLLCHPKVMSHGLNLTEADMLIFYAPIYSNDQYLQVLERLNRPGQKRRMTTVRIGANPLEWKIYKALDGKGITQSNILDLYQQEIAEAA